MEIILDILGKGVWAGVAAIGFAVLFNVPRRTLTPIWFLACLGTMVKYTIMHFDQSIILGSFAGSVMIGIAALYAARNFYTPPLVFSIPSVIPMIPGFFTYNMMLGFIKLSNLSETDNFVDVLSFTTSNGLKALFILMGLATGVAIPMLIARKESIKKIEHNKN
jgi:uncharacterized membrane protein YjjB (DUF3815 family)